MRKYNTNLQMMRVSEDNQSNIEKEYTRLERKMHEVRSKWMQMQEATA